MTWRGAGIGSYRYGSRVLWTIDGDLAGSRAVRFAGRVALFFRTGGPSLAVDLRRVGFVDSAGADALSRLCASYPHPQLVPIGRPAAWEDCPVDVRRRLLELAAAADLESALAPGPRAAAVPERRRAPRVPLQLPVELCLPGGPAAAAVQDISRGGVRLRVCGRAAEALRDGAAFDIVGLAEDPLGRELLGPGASLAVRAASVGDPADAGVGARFAGGPPPV